MSEPFSQISLISDEYEYSNILIKLPSNIMRSCICANSGIQINSDICLVNMWHLKIYSDIHLVHNAVSEYIWIFVRVHFMILAHHWRCT